MKNALFFTLLLSVSLVFSSCRKDPYHKYSRKLAGNWQFTKIHLKEYGALFKEDYLSVYGNSILRLEEDRLAYFEHNNRTYWGSWDILLNDCVNACSEELFISVYNYEFDHLIQFSMNDFTITNRKINAQNSTYEGTWTYRLVKL